MKKRYKKQMHTVFKKVQSAECRVQSAELKVHL